MRKTIAQFVFVFILALFSGCNTPYLGSGHYIVGAPYPARPTTVEQILSKDERKVIGKPFAKSMADDIEARAKGNYGELQWYQDHEGKLSRYTRRPAVCVSLSGGGIRSAAFSVGVLKGLSELQPGNGDSLLNQVNIISGTSGGAYAIGWYYMNQYGAPEEKKELMFSKPTLDALSAKASFYTLPEYMISGFANVVLLSPLNFLLNGIPFGLHANTSYAHHVYERNIKSTFLASKTAKLDKLVPVITQNKLPYFIITTTARVDVSTFHQDASLANTVFEFTPIRFGSDGFLYHDSKDSPVDLAEIISIAGAAPDTTQLISGDSQRAIASVFNADLGRYIGNINDTRSPFRKVMTKLAPFPLYLFTESYNHDLRGSDIYLSDGGHQENLAVYPLVKRACENIIVVDGEYDPNYEFESYFKLRAALERELQANVKLFPTDMCSSSKTPCQENNVDAIRGALQDNQERPSTREEAEKRRFGLPRNYFTGQHPIMQGVIGFFPVKGPEDHDISWYHSNLTYIKLSIDEGQFIGWDMKNEDEKKRVYANVGESASLYFIDSVKNTCETKPWFTPCAFPQYSTVHQSFTKKQFEAYVDLGATMVKNHLSVSSKNGKLLFAPQ